MWQRYKNKIKNKHPFGCLIFCGAVRDWSCASLWPPLAHSLREPAYFRLPFACGSNTLLEFFIPNHTGQIKNAPLGRFLFVADGEGFEPPDELPRQRFSRPSHSTALPTIRNSFCNAQFIFARTESQIIYCLSFHIVFHDVSFCLLWL